MTEQIILGLILAALVSFISYKVKFLTLDGAIATFILASLIFGLGGIKWSVPIMVFFIFSSILSKVRVSINREVEIYFEKSGVRDAMQVASNGGVGGILVAIYFFYQNEIYYLIYAACLAAVCADTWATEIGTLYRTKTYNILNFKPIDQGISGGVSLIGFGGAALGALVIAVSVVYWIQFNLLSSIILIITAGVLGSIFDSILGASIQAQYECNTCGKITERIIHCEAETSHKKGFVWLSNDLVNLFAGLSGGVFIYLIKEFLFI